MQQCDVGSKTKYSAETVQKRHANRKHACLKGEVTSAWREKYCTVVREMEKMLVILSEMWSY